MKLCIVFALVAAAAAGQISNEYLPPNVGGGVGANSFDVAAAAAPSNQYLAPNVGFESQDSSAAAPGHSFTEDDGYRYKTQRRRVFKTARRHRREVSSEYLPPFASNGAQGASYSGSSGAVSAPSNQYLAPNAGFEVQDNAGSVAGHSFSDADGYRYKTQRRRLVVRRNRF